MITESLDPFRIDDHNYKNGDIELRIWWGEDGDYQIVTDNGYISGFHNNGDVTIWGYVWDVLHGLPVPYDQLQTEEMQELDPRDYERLDDYGDPCS